MMILRSRHIYFASLESRIVRMREMLINSDFTSEFPCKKLVSIQLIIILKSVNGIESIVCLGTLYIMRYQGTKHLMKP